MTTLLRPLSTTDASKYTTNDKIQLELALLLRSGNWTVESFIVESLNCTSKDKLQKAIPIFIEKHIVNYEIQTFSDVARETGVERRTLQRFSQSLYDWHFLSCEMEMMKIVDVAMECEEYLTRKQTTALTYAYLAGHISLDALMNAIYTREGVERIVSIHAPLKAKGKK